MEQQSEALNSSLSSAESEKLLIAAMLSPARADLLDHTLSLITPNDFFYRDHSSIWSFGRRLHSQGKSVDIASVIAASKASPDTDAVDAQYLLSILQSPIAKTATDAAVLAAASRVKDLALKRSIQAACLQIINDCSGDSDCSAVLGRLEDEASSIRAQISTNRTGPQHALHFYESVIDNLAKKIENPDAPTEARPTKFDALNELLGGGMLPEDVVIIAGRPGMGKTALADNLLDDMAERNIPTLTFSLEMSGQSLSVRSIARKSRVNLSKIKKATLSDTELDSVYDSVRSLVEQPKYIDETPGLKLSEIRARARRWAKSNPKGIIAIDYVGLIAVSHPRLDRTAHMTEVSLGLKQLARELKMPVIELAQLNRDLEKRVNKRPILADLRESGQLEQDASVIIFVYRDEVYNPESKDKGIVEIIVAKNRDGPTGTVRGHMSPGTSSIEQIDASYDTY